MCIEASSIFLFAFSFMPCSSMCCCLWHRSSIRSVIFSESTVDASQQRSSQHCSSFALPPCQLDHCARQAQGEREAASLLGG
ncbi:hypothetical protein B0H13DRAFT_2166081, partial [Mycena leptocephala]